MGVHVCSYFGVLREREKGRDVSTQNRKGFKIRVQCTGENISEGHFLLLLFLGSRFWASSASPGAGERLWIGRTGATFLLGPWLLCRGDRARDCALSLAAMGMQREVGTSGCGLLSVSLQGQWFLAQDVVAGKPDCSGMLCSRVLWLCSPGRQAKNSVCSPCRLRAPPGHGHTLPRSLAHWTPCNSHSALESRDTFLGPEHSVSLTTQGRSDFLYLCLTPHKHSDLGPMGRSSIPQPAEMAWVFAPPLASYTQRAVPDLLCSVTSSSPHEPPLLFLRTYWTAWS